MNDDLIRAQAMLDADKPKEAVKILNRLIDTGEPDAEALFTRGKALWRMGCLLDRSPSPRELEAALLA
ncbi:MAG: hypothetical protein K2J18_01485 [Paramuribaculum sp.]|nr:hypothetical protein [Paramuribaculum sp.]